MLSEFYFPSNESIFNNDIFLIDKKNNIVHKYVTFKENLTSLNSEYHYEMIPIKYINKLHDEYSDIIDAIDKIMGLTEIIQKNEIEVYHKLFISTRNLQDKASHIDESIMQMNFARKFFNVMVLLYIYKKINTSYNYTIFDNDIDISNLLEKNLSKVLYFIKDKNMKYDEIYKLISNTRVDNIKFGYKLIPLSINAAENPLNINIYPWKEHFISLKCTDLMLNNISSGFSIYCGWTYIRDVNFKIIHNLNLKQIIDKNLDYRGISGYLNRAKLKLDRINIDNDIKNKHKLQTFKNKLQDVLFDMKNDMLLSEVIMIMVNEHVGVSFEKILSNPIYIKNIGNPLVELNYDVFAKYMFEILYNLLCLHSILGVIHCDIHLGNITINKDYTFMCDNKSFNKNNMNTKQDFVDYKLSEKIYYRFMKSNHNCYIIDFGKASINPNFSNIYETDNEIGEFNYIYENLNDIINISDYVHYMTNIFHNLFPSHTKSKINYIISQNTSSVYKKLTAIDLYILSYNFKSLFKSMEKKIGLKQQKLIDRILNISTNILENEFYKDKVMEMYPAEYIINECFNDYIDNKSKHQFIYDYNKKINNSMYNYIEFNEKYLSYYKNIKKNNMFIILNIIPKRHVEKYL